MGFWRNGCVHFINCETISAMGILYFLGYCNGVWGSFGEQDFVSMLQYLPECDEPPKHGSSVVWGSIREVLYPGCNPCMYVRIRPYFQT